MMKDDTIQNNIKKNDTLQLIQVQVYQNQDITLIKKQTSVDLSGRFDVFKTIESYSDNMLIFQEILNSYETQNIHIQHQCQPFSKLDNGSFGSVDLYLFEKDDNHSNLNQNQLQMIKTNNNYYKNNSFQSQGSQSTQANSHFQFDSQQSNSIKSNQSQPQFGNILSFNTKAQSQESTQIDSLQYNTSKSLSTNEMKYEIKQNQDQQIQQNQQLNLNPKIQIENQSQNQMKKNILPVAGKKIKKWNEFVRELYIMQTVECRFMPKLLGKDIDNQILFIELGLCNLQDLRKDSLQKQYKFSDEFLLSLLINLICAIEAQQSNYNKILQTKKSFFHSDIKPQNIILTVEKSLINNESQIKLLLIDFGGASFEVEDYWSYFTPAFVCPYLWQKLVDTKSKNQYLTWEEIRYAEIYAACRSVQYLMLNDKQQYFFKRENSKEFIDNCENEYPKICSIFKDIYLLNNQRSLNFNYKDTLSLHGLIKDTNIKDYHIEFDANKVYQISKFYHAINSQYI